MVSNKITKTGVLRGIQNRRKRRRQRVMKEMGKDDELGHEGRGSVREER